MLRLVWQGGTRLGRPVGRRPRCRVASGTTQGVRRGVAEAAGAIDRQGGRVRRDPQKGACRLPSRPSARPTRARPSPAEMAIHLLPEAGAAASHVFRLAGWTGSHGWHLRRQASTVCRRTVARKRQSATSSAMAHFGVRAELATARVPADARGRRPRPAPSRVADYTFAGTVNGARYSRVSCLLASGSFFAICVAGSISSTRFTRAPASA